MAPTSKTKTVQELTPGDKVLVTGAAGGLGRHVVHHLLKAGYQVRGVDQHEFDGRSWEEFALEATDLEWVTSDLRYNTTMAALLEGCAAVVHTAALVTLSDTYVELSDTNVGVVRRLYEAAGTAGCKHFVQISCASVYQADRGVRSEMSPVDPFNDYEATKLDAENALVQGRGRGVPTAWTVLRPTLLYGPGCTEMGAGMVTLPPILRGSLRYLPGLSGGPRTNWCHVHDAATAVLTVLGRPEAYDRCFNVADDTPLSFGEVLTSIADAYGLEPGPSVPLPNTTIWAVLSPVIDNDLAFDFVRQLLRQLWKREQSRRGIHSPLRPRVDRSALFYVTDDSIIVAAALKELGWAPKWPDFRVGIIETIRWYQAQGWVPRFDIGAEVKLSDERREVGLGYSESFRGALQSDDSRALMSLDLDVDWPQVLRFSIAATGHINGHVTIKDLVTGAPVQGTISMRLLPVPQLHYEFGFEDANKSAYRFCGQRRLSVKRPMDSLGKLSGTLVNKTGERVGEAVLRFEVREELLPLVRSLHSVR